MGDVENAVQVPAAYTTIRIRREDLPRLRKFKKHEKESDAEAVTLVLNAVDQNGVQNVQ